MPGTPGIEIAVFAPVSSASALVRAAAIAVSD
jgi:hypothetical protein